ncbi:MAG: hypothetical protein JST02_11315 [Bacteroidetes bacterium]|jgi:hypothetical protein|nr:hypothetical protein [Bacteroidota bacterium]
MTIEKNMQIEYRGNQKVLIVKMIYINNTRYFFIREAEPSQLPGDLVLELTYESGSFHLSSFGGEIRTPGVSSDIVETITEALKQDELLWHNG